MCFLPYPSIPPPFSYYSAWIPLERSFGYSYSFQSIGVNRAAFGVILLQYSPAFLVLLSVDTARQFTLLLLLIFLLFSLSLFFCSPYFFFFFSFFFFFLSFFFSLSFVLSIGVNQKCLLYFNFPLSIPPPFLYYSVWIPSRILYSYSI